MSTDIEFLSAVIVISDDPRRLAGFYRDTLGLPLHPEQHDDDRPHWGGTLGPIHFAIHHIADFPEHQRTGSGAVVIALAVDDLDAVLERLNRHGIEPLYPPKDLGWTRMTAVHDPDHNLVELTQMAGSWWTHVAKRRAEGHDPVERWLRRTGPSPADQHTSNASGGLGLRPYDPGPALRRPGLFALDLGAPGKRCRRLADGAPEATRPRRPGPGRTSGGALHLDPVGAARRLPHGATLARRPAHACALRGTSTEAGSSRPIRARARIASGPDRTPRTPSPPQRR